MARGTEASRGSLATIARALRQAAPVLVADPPQLASQLIARLGDDPDAGARALSRSARPSGAEVWLRPIAASLGGGTADVLSLPGGWDWSVAFAEHAGHPYLVLGDRSSYSLWDVERGEHVTDVPPPDDARAEPEHAACGQVGDRFVVLIDDPDVDRTAVSAWTLDSSTPIWESAAWMDPSLEDPLVRLEGLALGGDPADPVAAVSLWHREENVNRVWLLDAATGSVRRTIELGRTGSELMVLGGVRGRTLLATGRFDSENVWDVSSGELIHTVPAGGITWGRAPVAFGDVGEGWAIATILKADGEDGVGVWDGDTGERLAFLPFPREVADLRFAGGALVVGHADRLSQTGEVLVWDVSTRSEVLTIPLATKNTASVAVRAEPSPRLLATVTDDTARVWDLDRLIAEGFAPPVHEAAITAVAFGEVAASADRNGVVRTWTEEGTPADRVELSGPVLGLAWCAIDRAGALAAASAGEIVVVDPASGRTLRRIPVSGTVEEGALAAIETGGDWCAAIETSRLVMPDQIDEWDPDAELGQPVNVHQVQVFDLATGSKRYEVGHSGTPMPWRLGGRAAFVVLGRYGSGAAVDARSGEPVGVPSPGVDPAGTAVKVAAVRHALGEAGGSLAGIRGELAAVVGSDRVAMSWGREIRVWDLAGARPLTAFTADDRITCFAVRSDGRRIVVGDRAGAVHLLDL